MKADEIYVRVNRGAANAPAQVSNVVSKGSVHLTQAQKDGAEPLLIEGDQLDIDNRGPTDQEMVVHGQPGHVKNRGAHIEGSRIVFDRGKNTADVDGAGTLHLPVKQSTEAGKPEKTAPFDVSWLNNMHFDGKTALFIGSVHSKLDDGEEQSDIRCKEMGVTFTKPFSFSKERKDQDQPEIDTIDCYGGVNFESKTIVDGNLTEKRRGQVTQLHFHKPNGQSEAQGPGVLACLAVQRKRSIGLAQFANVQANSPPKTQKHAQWEYMQVKFDGRMDGDFRQMMSPPPGQKKPSQPREPSVTFVSGRRSKDAAEGPPIQFSAPTALDDHLPRSCRGALRSRRAADGNREPRVPAGPGGLAGLRHASRGSASAHGEQGPVHYAPGDRQQPDRGQGLLRRSRIDQLRWLQDALRPSRRCKPAGPAVAATASRRRLELQRIESESFSTRCTTPSSRTRCRTWTSFNSEPARRKVRETNQLRRCVGRLSRQRPFATTEPRRSRSWRLCPIREPTFRRSPGWRA